MTDLPPNQTSDLTWLLSSLVQTVPHTHSALLLSSDGLSKYVYGLDADDADKLAAVASSLCSLTRSFGAHFGSGGKIRQVIADSEDLMLFVSAAGPGAVLAVLADRETNVNVLGYEMGQLIKAVPSRLATPARQAAPARHATTDADR